MLPEGQGKVYYGMHFYPGVAQYDNLGIRVFINENTIRKMNPTFAGRPVFVDHVDGVDGDVDQLRKEADGWVVESFYNEADGKTWVKFIVVTARAERAIGNGFRLSNAYNPKGPFGDGGLASGVPYAKEILDGEYEHLAIVKTPRYEESTIMTPDEFKNYNENLKVEIKRLANSQEKGTKTMKLNLWKREKVTNSADLEGVCVTLPKSGKEMNLVDMVEKMDKIENMAGYADGGHMVKIGNEEMTVNDLVKKHGDMCNDMAKMKAEKENSAESEEGLEMGADSVDVEGDMHNEEDGVKKKAAVAASEEDEIDAAREKKANEDKDAKEKMANDLKAKKAKNLAALKNAASDSNQEVARVDLSEDRLARGKSRYGSN